MKSLDTLTPRGNSYVIKNMEECVRLASRLTIRRPRQIEVKETWHYPRQINVVVSRDGYLQHCTHTDYEIQDIELDDTSADYGTHRNYFIKAYVCQHCNAMWDEDGEEISEGK